MSRTPRTRRQVRPQVEPLYARCVPAGITFNPGTGVLTVTGAGSVDRVQITNQTGGSADLVVVQLRSAGAATRTRSFNASAVTEVVFQGTGGNDRCVNRTAEDLTADGGAGNDTITGGLGDDVLRGRAGDDHLYAGVGDDSCQGGGGDDVIQGNQGDDSVLGGGGNDDVGGDIGDDTCRGGGGDDSLHGGLGDDDLDGEDGSDCVSGDGGHDRERGGERGDGDVQFETNLTSTTGAFGKAEFNASRDKFEVEVYDGPASVTLEVVVDGVTVGTLRTNSSGDGEMELYNVTFTVEAGSTIAVGDPDDGGLSGTFANEDELELKADLDGATGAEGEAEFDLGDQELKVKVEDAAANTTYDITIDGVVVGQITTDSRGDGRVEFFGGGLAVNEGSTLTVEDEDGTVLVEGTFENSSGDDGDD